MSQKTKCRPTNGSAQTEGSTNKSAAKQRARARVASPATSTRDPGKKPQVSVVAPRTCCVVKSPPRARRSRPQPVGHLRGSNRDGGSAGTGRRLRTLNLQAGMESSSPTGERTTVLPEELFAHDCIKAVDAVSAAPPDQREAPAAFMAHAAQELMSKRFFADREASEAFVTAAATIVGLLPHGTSAAVSKLRHAEGIRALLFCLSTSRSPSARVAESAVSVLQRLVTSGSPEDAHAASDTFALLGGVQTVCGVVDAHSTVLPLQLARPFSACGPQPAPRGLGRTSALSPRCITGPGSLLPATVPCPPRRISSFLSQLTPPPAQQQQDGCKLLRALTLSHEENAAAAVDAGGLSIARRLMAQRHSVTLRYAACKLASSLGARTPERALAALQAGCVAEIAHLVTESVLQPDRMEVAASALESLASCDETRVRTAN